MSLIKSLYDLIIDSLFPLSLPEQELFSYSPEEAWLKLPRAPETPFRDTRSVFAYKDPRVTKLVWNIKYKRSEKATAIGGYALFRALQTDSCMRSVSEGKPSITIIPMPITPKRLRERGFNQCHLLVDEIARLDASRRFEIEKNLLVRVHHASRQTLKNREERLKSAKGVFAVNEEAAKRFKTCDLRFKNVNIIVIDDVITTGSTMNEAMETLKKYGFENVIGLSLAH